MKVINIKGEFTDIRISRDEMCFLCNAINEALEAVEDCEFSTRLGFETEEAKCILRAMNEMINEMDSK